MSIYAQATLGTDANKITFNDFTSDPVFRAVGRVPNKFQMGEQDIPVSFESGISDFQTLVEQTDYIIKGVMYPGSEASYDSGLNALRTVASLDIEQADAASDLGYVPYRYGDASGDLTKQIFVKPLYLLAQENTRQGFVMPFTILCKIKDPTIFGAAKTATTQSANFGVTTGAAVFPIAFPVVFGATLFSVSSTATNNGTLAGYPGSIVVNGPVNVPKVTNTTTGEYIIVNTNLSSSSDVLTIAYDKDSLSIDLNGTSQLQNLSTDSTLFKLKPGQNVIQLTGTSVSTNAYAVVNYWDYYPLA